MEPTTPESPAPNTPNQSELLELRERLKQTRTDDLLNTRGHLGSIAMGIAMLAEDQPTIDSIHAEGTKAWSLTSRRAAVEIQTTLLLHIKALLKE